MASNRYAVERESLCVYNQRLASPIKIHIRLTLKRPSRRQPSWENDLIFKALYLESIGGVSEEKRKSGSTRWHRFVPPPQPTITIQFISSRVDLRLRRVVVDANRHVCVCFYLHTDVAARMIVDKMASVTASITASEKSESATKFRIRSRKREDKKKN